MTITVRDAVVKDAEAIVQAHYSAVHQIASKDYPVEILNEWSPSNLSERIAKFERLIEGNSEGEIIVVAELDGKVVGFGSIVPDKKELRAVYVSAAAGAKGVGKAILEHLESKAKELNVPELNLDSSVTAEHFYARHGYEVIRRGLHRLNSGRQMACIFMRKEIKHD